MLTLQQLADIAGRHYTRMADAMIAACIRHATEANIPLSIPERPEKRKRHRHRKRKPKGGDELTHEEWREMVERNSDTEAMRHG